MIWLKTLILELKPLGLVLWLLHYLIALCCLQLYKHGGLTVLLCILRRAVAFCGINLRNVGTIQQANAQ